MKKECISKLIAFGLAFVIGFFGILPVPEIGEAVYAADDKEEVTAEPANLLERAISTVFLLGATGLFFLISIAAGSVITVETIIFNKFATTKLNIFSGMDGWNPYVGDPMQSGTIGAYVNTFFSFFTKIALVAFMVILVYVGIRILLNTGTDKNAKYKEYLLYWVQGIFILFFFPYVMKYTIVINDTFVQYIYEMKAYNAVALGDAISHPSTQTSTSGMSDMETGLKSLINFFKSEGNTDYMSLMFRQGWEKGWLVYALCFSVMVMQILLLLVIYFKRLLIILFLIVCFPLVMISYAIDKLGDGKSQAFGNWYKEFAINVFMNSFHAIVYVIGMAFIAKLGTSGSKNWLLMVILLSFVSKGDEMLRGIFHMNGGETTKSLGKTMLQAQGAVAAVKTASGVANKLVGKDSRAAHIKQGLSNVASANREKTLAGLNASNAMLDEQITQNQQTQAEMAAPQAMHDAAATALNKDSTDEERNQALDQILTVMNMKDGAEKDALLADMFADMSEEDVSQLEEMLKARAAVNALASGGLTEVQFTENIEVLLVQMKNKAKHPAAARIASQFIGDEKNLNRLKLASQMKLKKPSSAGFSNIANTGSKRDAARKKGRYSGRFSQISSVQKMAVARASLEPKDNSLRGRFTRAAGSVGAAGLRAKSEWQNYRLSRDFKKNYDRTALKEARSILQLEKELLRLKRQGKTNTAQYKQLSKQIGNMKNSSRGNVEKLRKKREELRRRGVRLSYDGKTDNFLKTRNDRLQRYGKRLESKDKLKGYMYHPIKTAQSAGKKITTEGGRFLNEQKKRLTAQALETRKQLNASRDIAKLRKMGRNATAADKLKYDREAQAILNARNKEIQELRSRNIRISNMTERAYNRGINRAGRRQELDALRSLRRQDRATARAMKKDYKEGVQRNIEIFDQARTTEAQLLRSRGILVKPPRASMKKAKDLDAKYTKYNLDKERKSARADDRAFKNTAYDRANEARKRTDRAKSELDAARRDIQKAGTDPSKLKSAQEREKKALEQLTSSTQELAGISKQLKENRARLKESGVKLARPSGFEKSIDKGLNRDLQDAMKQERLASKQSERARNRKEIREEYNNRIELVDVRALAEKKQAKREAKAQQEATRKENSMAEKLKQRQQESQLADTILGSRSSERDALQSAMRAGGIVLTDQTAWSKAGEKLVSAFNGVKSVPSKVSDLGKATYIGIDDGAYALAGAINEIPNIPGRVADTFKTTTGKISDGLFGTNASGMFGKNTEGMTLSDEIKTYAGRKEEERKIIRGIFTEEQPVYTPIGTEPTSSSPTVVVVGGDTSGTSTEGKWVVPINSAAETDLARRNVENAKLEAREKAKQENPNISDNDSKLSPIDENNLFQISCSVVALNQLDLGQYTATEMLAHIDNIKRLKASFPAGSPGYEELNQLLSGLKFDLDDIESTVRIQVLNDPSLVAANDSRKRDIMDSSISYVQNMSQDDVLLGTLSYSPDELQTGYTPIHRTHGSHETITGLASGGVTLTAAEEASVQASFAEQLRQQQREAKIQAEEAKMEAASAKLRSELGGLAKNAAGAAVDLAVGMPLAVGGGLMAMGMDGADKKDNPLVVGLAGYKMGDSLYGAGKGVVTKIGGEVTSSIKGALSGSKSGESSSKEKTKPITYEAVREQAIAAKRERYQGITSVPKAGEKGSVSELYKQYKASQGGSNS